MADWDESEHPRDGIGRFRDKAGGWVDLLAARLQPGRVTAGVSTPRRPRQARGQRYALPRVSEGRAQSAWGGSHATSFSMAGESAALMGITGYRRYGSGIEDFLQSAATRFLRTIYEGSQPSDVRRFHGTSGQQWADVQPGQVVDLPLTATGRDRGTVSYATRGDRDAPQKPAYLVVFPRGTATAGISHEWDENGDYRLPTWDEAVVAGRFRVKARHEVRTPGVGYYTRIELEPTEVFDPTHRRWVPPRRRLRAGHDFGRHQQMVDELRDGGARVHPDGTVSVWRILQLGANDDGTDAWEYTTNGRMARERAGWRDEPEPPEVRLPLDEVRMLFQYSDETRLAIP